MDVLERFLKDKDNYVSRAIQLGETCPYGKIELTDDIADIGNLDVLVEIMREEYQKHVIDDDDVWNVSVLLGTLLGEMIIREIDGHWEINEDELPVVKESSGNGLSPISKILKIITSEDNDEGSPSIFYEGYQALKRYHDMSDEEKEAITTYVHTDKGGER